MDFKALHEKFKDENSPSVELQIRWLQKMGFQPHQVDQAMITVYSEIEAGKTFKDGSEFNLYLKDAAGKIRTEELEVYIRKLEQFEANMRIKLRKEWEKELPWWKKLLGIKK